MSVFEKFRQVFISEKNSNYVLQVVQNRLGLDKIHTTMTDLIQLQNMIYATYFEQICNDLSRRGKLSLEEALITLNRITVEKLELDVITDAAPRDYTIPQTIQTKDIDTSVHKDTTVSEYHHFFSSDAGLDSGRYTFPVEMNKVTSITMCGFELDCNIYNVTESNNKFYIEEGNNRVQISLPIGYYKFDDLCSAMTRALNVASPNKFEYTVSRNVHKNKTYFQCHTKSANFNVGFFGDPSPQLSLREILGFKTNIYMNNNIYVSETHPITSVCNNLFVKLYLGDKEVPRVKSSRPSFSYFQALHVNLDKHFGEIISLPIHQEPFDMSEELTTDTLSVELWSTQQHICTRLVHFDFVLCIEKSV
jgi:hypothetical protein